MPVFNPATKSFGVSGSWTCPTNSTSLARFSHFMAHERKPDSLSLPNT